jgi:glutamate racemase
LDHLSSDKPIGIFDSGIGGLTVANAVRHAFPLEDIIYFGDTAHLPYGDKSADTIRYYAIRISKFLLEQECKMIIIACNSASSAAYEVLLDFFKDKAIFVNVVDPLVQKTIDAGYKKVGVIATKATVNSSVYKNKIESHNQFIEVIQQATPLLAPMIEEGFCNDDISHSVISKYLSSPDFKDIDALLLACTHYPLIKNEIGAFFDNKIDILDSTQVVVDQVRKILDDKQLHNQNESKEPIFYVSDYTSSFEETTNVFYGRKVELIEKSIW